jgi:oxygen-dependent protoporphyrinogen oxidase
VNPAVAIVGGGISGLTAAYQLQSAGVPFVLLERGDRLGGVVMTERVLGYTIDAGPDALLTQKTAAIDLCGELGLGARLRPQLRRNTFVVRTRRLRELPEASVLGIPTQWMPFVTTDAFSWLGKLRMATEPLWPAAVAAADESIASFIGRRFGQEAVAYLAEPLLAGIHGGDPAQLSMRAAFPRFLELEAKFGSVIAGLRKIRAAQSGSNGQHGAPFVSLPGGMSELVEALIGRLPPASLRTSARVARLAETGRGFAIGLQGGDQLDVRALVLATPPLSRGNWCGASTCRSRICAAASGPRRSSRSHLGSRGRPSDIHWTAPVSSCPDGRSAPFERSAGYRRNGPTARPPTACCYGPTLAASTIRTSSNGATKR